MPETAPTGQQPKEPKPAASLDLGTNTEETSVAMPEAQAAPTVPAPEAGPTPFVDATQAEALVNVQPGKGVTFNPSEQSPAAATMAKQHADLEKPITTNAAADTNGNLAADPEEKPEKVGWLKRLFGGKKHEPETPLVMTGALPKVEGTEGENSTSRIDDLEARRKSGQIFVPASERNSIGIDPNTEQPPQNPTPSPEEGKYDRAA